MKKGTVIKKYIELGIKSIMINGNDTMFFYKGERKTHKSLVCVRANFYYYVLTTEENWNMNSCTNNPYSIQVDNPETKLKLFNRT